jgi:DMSO/TMAO reductase YedYZ molybdopterin-dependent catalytic subunit
MLTAEVTVMTTDSEVAPSDAVAALSPPPRVADPDEGISVEELRLASRNHAMPAEAMRFDVTPPGLHYVLTHYDIPLVDAQSWCLSIGGCVDRALSLDLDALSAMPRHTVRVTLECAGNGRVGLSPRPISQPWLTGAVGTADWTGVRLRDLLADAGLTDNAVDVTFTGADHGVERGVEQDYTRGLSLAEATAPDVLVAYEMNGAPLPPQHGYPVRLVVPGWYGMAHVKWLRAITVIDHRFEGYQNVTAYRLRQETDEEGVPVTRIEPRALLVPPGFPEFLTRVRVVRPGVHTLEGRAWSGWGPVSRVEVSTDDGLTWQDAELGPSVSSYAWRRFTCAWEAAPGRHRLRVRAHDSTGRVQAEGPRWSLGGFTNNADEPVDVLVSD